MILVSSKNCVLNIERMVTAGMVEAKDGETVLSVEMGADESYEFRGDDAHELLEAIKSMSGRYTPAAYQTQP